MNLTQTKCTFTTLYYTKLHLDTEFDEAVAAWAILGKACDFCHVCCCGLHTHSLNSVWKFYLGLKQHVYKLLKKKNSNF